MLRCVRRFSRRHSSPLYAFFAIVIVLSGCDSQQPAQMEPQEVLAQAAMAMQQVEAASFAGEARLQLSNENGTADVQMEAQGVFGAAGRQLQTLLTIDADVQPVPGDAFHLAAQAELIALEDNETYINVHRVSVEPQVALLSQEAVEKFTNIWWMLPGAQPADPTATQLDPDPSLIRAQANIVRVVRNHGKETYEDTEVYRYDVELDVDKLRTYYRASGAEIDADTETLLQQLSANGVFRIDVETHRIRSIAWTVSPVQRDGDTASGDFSLTLSYDNGRSIVPPHNPRFLDPLQLFLEIQGAVSLQEDSAMLPVGDTQQ